MNRGKIVVHSQRSDYGRYQGLVVGIEDAQTGEFRYIKGPLLYEVHDTSMMILNPTFEGPDVNELLQAALDEAWRLGMRPTSYRDERPEQIKAMDNHLQDMRALVFAKPVTLIDPLGKAKATLAD